jgi:arginase
MTQTIRIIGVPMDLGQDRRGTDMGPSALRYAGLKARLTRLGYDVHDTGNVPVPVAEEMRDPPAHAPEIEGHAHHLEAVVTSCKMIYEAAKTCCTTDDIALIMGGDHSLSIGSIGGMASYDEPLGVLWIDAHGDYNTPQTSSSGNVHGMPLAALAGLGPLELVNLGHAGRKLDPVNVAIIGLRDLDAVERTSLAGSGMALYTMRDIDERGMSAVAREALARLESITRLHVSLDMDSLDPEHAPGVGTPAPGGLTYREAHLLMEIVADSKKVRSLDVVEINPVLDQHNQTAELAVELVASLLGQSIL